MREYTRQKHKKKPEWRVHPSRIMLLELERLARLSSSLLPPSQSPAYPQARKARERYFLNLIQKELERLAGI